MNSRQLFKLADRCLQEDHRLHDDYNAADVDHVRKFLRIDLYEALIHLAEKQKDFENAK